jgi:hypothetical protein
MVVNDSSWWVDTSATCHICGDRNLFKKYEKVGDEIKLYMGNSTTTKVVEKCIVELKFTFDKIITLIDAFHAPENLKEFGFW